MKIIAAIVALCLSLPVANGAPYMLSDDRIRNLDVTPVLGRGYSIMTNTFLSTCLDGAETTLPSYNYDYTFTDFTRSKDYVTELATSELSQSFAYPHIKKMVSLASNTKYDKFTIRKHYVVSSMRVERYYSSIKEEVSPLSKSAHELLNKQDYMGFFMACGPNYVRSIRRAQEVTAIFMFESPNVDLAQEFASGLKTSGFGSDVKPLIATKSKFKPLYETLDIKILAFGLGLGQSSSSSGGSSGSSGSSSTLIANSIEEFNQVMKFAFQSMTQNEGGSNHLGMVYGIEVIPFVDNVSFQVASKIVEETIEVPLSRSIMPRAFHITDSTIPWDPENRDDFRCLESSFGIDKYGYCCENNAMYDPKTKVYNLAEAQYSICRPLRVLDKSIVKNNMSTNAEFISRMDAAVRAKINQLSSLQQCVSVVRSIPAELDFNILKSQDSVAFDATIETSFTVRELKLALDPYSDYRLVKHMSNELDEFMDMYYSPCVKDLFGGKEVDSEATNFMINPWHVHDACMLLPCLTESMRWNRGSEAGCVASLITGSDAPDYRDGEDQNCKYNAELNEDTEVCLYDQKELSTYHTLATKCWKNALPKGGIDYFMAHFCLPVVTEEKVTQDVIDDMEFAKLMFCTPRETDMPSNMPSTSQSPSTSIAPSNMPSTSNIPSTAPSSVPTNMPSSNPSEMPSNMPSSSPSAMPSTSSAPTAA